MKMNYLGTMLKQIIDIFIQQDAEMTFLRRQIENLSIENQTLETKLMGLEAKYLNEKLSNAPLVDELPSDTL